MLCEFLWLFYTVQNNRFDKSGMCLKNTHRIVHGVKREKVCYNFFKFKTEN
jgi:hypothetical protein